MHDAGARTPNCKCMGGLGIRVKPQRIVSITALLIVILDMIRGRPNERSGKGSTPYEERFRQLNLCSTERRRLGADIVVAFKVSRVK